MNKQINGREGTVLPYGIPINTCGRNEGSRKSPLEYYNSDSWRSIHAC